MPRIAAGVLLTAMTLPAVTTSAGASGSVPLKRLTIPSPTVQRKAISPRTSKPTYIVMPLRGSIRGQAPNISGSSVPFWTPPTVAGQNGNTYYPSLVGANIAAGSSTTVIPLEVLPVVITFTGTGDVYDPTAVNAACGETISALNGVLTGPELARRSWAAGPTLVATHSEYLDAQFREDFWQTYTNPRGPSPAYHVFLSPSNPGSYIATTGYPEFKPGTCSEMGEIDLGAFDSGVRGLLNGTWGAGTLPLILVKNVVWTTNGGCCILGWHSAFVDNSGNTQTYAVASYLTDAEFGAQADLDPLSHEIAEWGHDPFGNNAVPPWGPIGPQRICANTLEVGDPLSGTVFTVKPATLAGGPTYHLQELALFGWFYNLNEGVNHWYSTKGTFTSGSTLCT